MTDPGKQTGHTPHPGGRKAHRGRVPLPRRHLAAVFAALLAAGTALLLTACSAADTPAAVAPGAVSPGTAAPGTGSVPQGSYVALGDSYTAGPDIPDPAGATPGCDQSGSSYPYLVAQRLRLKLTDMSCSSATVPSLSAPQSTSDGTNPAQLSALSARTGLVTLGIGGNDVDWASIITKCTELDLIPALIPGGATSDLAPCQDYYAGAGRANQIEQKIQAAAGDLGSALAQIRRLAPHARVYVVGYPDLLPASGGACAHALGLTRDDVSFLNDEETRLNGMLRQAALSADDGYIDTYAPSEGHSACSVPASRWVEPLLPASPAAPLHPNAVGEQGMADVVIHAVTGT